MRGREGKAVAHCVSLAPELAHSYLPLIAPLCSLCLCGDDQSDLWVQGGSIVRDLKRGRQKIVAAVVAEEAAAGQHGPVGGGAVGVLLHSLQQGTRWKEIGRASCRV